LDTRFHLKMETEPGLWNVFWIQDRIMDNVQYYDSYINIFISFHSFRSIGLPRSIASGSCFGPRLQLPGLSHFSNLFFYRSPPCPLSSSSLPSSLRVPIENFSLYRPLYFHILSFVCWIIGFSFPICQRCPFKIVSGQKILKILLMHLFYINIPSSQTYRYYRTPHCPPATEVGKLLEHQHINLTDICIWWQVQ
jgi:hypothetical protein